MDADNFEIVRRGLTKPTYTQKELLSCLREFENDESSSTAILKELQAKSILLRYRFPFPNRPFTIYAPPRTAIEVALMGVHPSIHLSHASSLKFHQLEDKPHERLYVNVEQSATSPDGCFLTQEGIDSAFRRKPRISNNIAKCFGVEVCMLAGKNTGNLGVVELRFDENHTVRVTSIERTLIDIVTRPSYAGGVNAVLGAFKKAHGRFSTYDLYQLLKDIKHIYPYHQCIGFFMEQTGVYSEEEIQPLRELPQNHDFYLTHQILESRYIPAWRIFVPVSIVPNS